MKIELDEKRNLVAQAFETNAKESLNRPVQIPLTNGFYAIISPQDSALVNKYKWHLGGYGNYKYAKTSVNGKTTRLHRYILNVTDSRIFVDHINHNGLDNRRENIRTCSNSQNIMNSKTKIGTSNYRGVYWNKQAKKWEARIRALGRKINLGQYYLEECAALAYDFAAMKHHREFATFNF